MVIEVDTSLVQCRDLPLEHRVREHGIQSCVDGIGETGNVVILDVIHIQGRQTEQVSVCCLALSKQSTSNMTADKTIAETFKYTVCVLGLGVLDGRKQLLGRFFTVHVDEFGFILIEPVQVYGIRDEPVID